MADYSYILLCPLENLYIANTNCTHSHKTWNNKASRINTVKEATAKCGSDFHRSTMDKSNKKYDEMWYS